MENTTPILDVNRKASLGNYAALPGSGPLGATCSHCALLDPIGSRFTCRQFKALTGRAGKPISPASPACRYFSQRPAFNSAKES
jgi:hypothetical protein